MKTACEQGRLMLLQKLDPSLSSSEVQKMHSSGKHKGAATARLQNDLHFRDGVGWKRMGDCLNELGMEDLKLLEEEMDKAAKILDDDGIAAPGEILRPYDIHINKQSPIDTRTPKTGSAANLPDRIWNHEEATLLNSFDNHDFPDKGISKLCVVNELDDSLLLAASSDGNIWIWKDYTLKGKQKLVIAFSSIHGHKPGVRSLNAVVDW
ncbi:hypothetical protein JHK82_043588 [Glycine max]|nr:hypothetical protein JHK82_043588 [Glycine max]